MVWKQVNQPLTPEIRAAQTDCEAVMKAKPKSLALAKFQQAGQLTIAKNKAAKVNGAMG